MGKAKAVEAAVLEDVRVVEVKGTEEPPVDKPYYGVLLQNGLREVKLRKSRVSTVRRDSKGNARNVYSDQVIGYEESVTKKETGEIIPIIYHTMTMPYRLDPNCLYPCAIWNVTPDRLDDVENIPKYKKQVVRGFKTGAPMNAGGMVLQAFYFVRLNKKYIPNVDANGVSDDGNWEIGHPILGSEINRELDEEENVGLNAINYHKLEIEPI